LFPIPLVGIKDRSSFRPPLIIDALSPSVVLNWGRCCSLIPAALAKKLCRCSAGHRFHYPVGVSYFNCHFILHAALLFHLFPNCHWSWMIHLTVPPCGDVFSYLLLQYNFWMFCTHACCKNQKGLNDALCSSCPLLWLLLCAIGCLAV
jgi:hypothetical protein